MQNIIFVYFTYYLILPTYYTHKKTLELTFHYDTKGNEENQEDNRS